MTIWDAKVTSRKQRAAKGDKPSNESVAIHEASHAVVAHKLGFVITRITQKFTERVPVPGSPLHLDEDLSNWCETVVKLAGLCGVARLHGQTSPFINDLECFYFDIFEVLLLHGNATPSVEQQQRDSPLWFGEAIREAASLVQEHWHLIEKVASELRNSGGKNDTWELTGEKLTALLPALDHEIKNRQPSTGSD